MRDHKFKVGQVVSLIPALRDGTSSSVREYKILRLLPGTGGECAYHVKTITEASARVAKEGELAELKPSMRTIIRMPMPA